MRSTRTSCCRSSTTSPTETSTASTSTRSPASWPRYRSGLTASTVTGTSPGLATSSSAATRWSAHGGRCSARRLSASRTANPSSGSTTRRNGSPRRPGQSAGGPAARRRTRRGPMPSAAPPAPSITSCCPTPAWSATATMRPRRWYLRVSSGFRSGARVSSSRLPPSRLPSSKGFPTAWINSGRCTPNSSSAITGTLRTRCRSGASPPPAIDATPPTRGRTASAPRASSATTPGPPAPTAG